MYPASRPTSAGTGYSAPMMLQRMNGWMDEWSSPNLKSIFYATYTDYTTFQIIMQMTFFFGFPKYPYVAEGRFDMVAMAGIEPPTSDHITTEPCRPLLAML